MSKNKVLIMLGALSPQEFKKFGLFLRRIHSRKETLLKLFDILRRYHPEFEAPQLEYRNLYRKILPDKKYHEKRILNEMSVLRAAIEQFMVEQYLEENEHTRNAIILQAYKRHQLDDLFFGQLQKMEQAIEGSEETSQLWLQRMNLADEYYYYPSTRRITGKAPRIYEAMEYLDHFYAISKLQYACEALNRSKVLREARKEIRLLEEVQSLPNFDNSVCFHAYFLALALIDTRDDSIYWELKEHFKANFKKIRPKDRLIIFNYLINHISHGIKKGVEVYNQEIFGLYHLGIENEILIINGYFDVPSFENAVIIFCKDKQYEWAMQFISKWGGSLKPEIRKDIIAISEAYILFEQRRYSEAHQRILQFEELDFHDHIRAYVLLTSCYVELDEYSSNFINDKCDSFARATRRNRVISSETKRAVLNFLKIVKQLEKPGLDKASLLKELSKIEFVFSRKWLIEKIQAL